MYVLDTYAVLELDRVLPAGQARLNAFAELSRLVALGEVVFPDAVLRDCRVYAGDEVGSVWLIGVASSRKGASFSGGMPIEVLGICPDLCVAEQEGEQSQIDVACLAKTHVDHGAHVVVVTEDPGIGGDRITLGEACDTMGISHCDAQKMLAELGLT